MPRQMLDAHDGWLGEPFNSDFGAAWGVIIKENIHDGRGARTLQIAVTEARAKNLRYVIYVPWRATEMTPTRCKPKLYRIKGTTALEVYYYLERYRPARNDYNFLRYHRSEHVRQQAAEACRRNRPRWGRKPRQLNMAPRNVALRERYRTDVEHRERMKASAALWREEHRDDLEYREHDNERNMARYHHMQREKEKDNG